MYLIKLAEATDNILVYPILDNAEVADVAIAAF